MANGYVENDGKGCGTNNCDAARAEYCNNPGNDNRNADGNEKRTAATAIALSVSGLLRISRLLRARV